MATTQDRKNDSAQSEDVAIDVLANDLKHIGTDTLGYNHYHDVQRDRIVVTTQTHKEYGKGLVRRSLTANAAEVDAIIPDVTGEKDAAKYIGNLDVNVEGRDWESVHVKFFDFDAFVSEVA